MRNRWRSSPTARRQLRPRRRRSDRSAPSFQRSEQPSWPRRAGVASSFRLLAAMTVASAWLLPSSMRALTNAHRHLAPALRCALLQHREQATQAQSLASMKVKISGAPVEDHLVEGAPAGTAIVYGCTPSRPPTWTTTGPAEQAVERCAALRRRRAPCAKTAWKAMGDLAPGRPCRNTSPGEGRRAGSLPAAPTSPSRRLAGQQRLISTSPRWRRAPGVIGLRLQQNQPQCSINRSKSPSCLL